MRMPRTSLAFLPAAVLAAALLALGSSGESARSASGEPAPGFSYEAARWHPIHFKPEIDKATNDQCLACHKEILDAKPREVSPAGVKAADSLAWYQTLDTYSGPQSDFHARHLTSDFARQTMDLKCNFCHQGNDPREEAPGSSADNQHDKGYALRKTVDPAKSCLRCHGSFPHEIMTGLDAPWPQARENIEDPNNPDALNGCLTCHKEMYRTVRHQVTYLKPDNIEQLAASGSSDACYGCHGGRQWYRNSYPYPRHKWPDMENYVQGVPEWAYGRPMKSELRYRNTQLPDSQK